MGFEPTISESERPKTYALDHAATGTGKLDLYKEKMFTLISKERKQKRQNAEGIRRSKDLSQFFNSD